MLIKIPTSASFDVQEAFRAVSDLFDRLLGKLNVDLKGRRIINAGAAQSPTDYATLADVDKRIEMRLATRDRASATSNASRVIRSGFGGTGSVGQGSVTATTELADMLADVEAYAAANPVDLANSCIDTGGTWDFMDGLVAYLQAIDERVGFNGKRGDITDPSEDAIAYYHGPLPPISGSNDVYVIDVIAGHCGPSPSAAWQNVTTPLAAGAWLPFR